MSGEGEDERKPRNVLRAALNASEFQTTTQYIERGRRFSSLSDDELKSRLLVAVTRNARAPFDQVLVGECSDLTAELGLRGVDATSPQLTAAYQRYFAKVKAKFESIVRKVGPLALDHATAEVYDEMLKAPEEDSN